MGARMKTFAGTTRLVVVRGGVAVKFARHAEGRRCNLEEARLWRRYKDHERRGKWLCPVLWCSGDGAVSVMAAAEPLPDGQEPWREADAEWDYMPGGDDGSPWEGKRADWGTLDGRAVAVDYATGAMTGDPPDDAAPHGNG